MEDNSLEQSAIQAALAGDWEKAAQINCEILKKNPQDPDVLNRLARAYAELGETEKTKDCYHQVLRIDPANSIASKNLKLLTKSANGTNGKNGYNINPTGSVPRGIISLDIFLSEPGRTKLVNLVNVATPATLSALTCGEKVQIVLKKHQVVMESLDGNYLGAIPDDLSHYLISLTHAGNCYEAYVKAVKINILTVIIAEKVRAAKFANQPSFLSRKQSKSLQRSLAEPTLPNAELVEGLLESSEL